MSERGTHSTPESFPETKKGPSETDPDDGSTGECVNTAGQPSP